MTLYRFPREPARQNGTTTPTCPPERCLPMSTAPSKAIHAVAPMKGVMVSVSTQSSELAAPATLNP